MNGRVGQCLGTVVGSEVVLASLGDETNGCKVPQQTTDQKFIVALGQFLDAKRSAACIKCLEETQVAANAHGGNLEILSFILTLLQPLGFEFVWSLTELNRRSKVSCGVSMDSAAARRESCNFNLLTSFMAWALSFMAVRIGLMMSSSAMVTPAEKIGSTETRTSDWYVLLERDSG